MHTQTLEGSYKVTDYCIWSGIQSQSAESISWDSFQ